ncbi:uncharacterized protein LOC113271551 [Papaver somniferum]|uniref:uncharacterized protein LOC113271551 n=1 Tax=Papaver somniferum TaxID=3469 RepID=UPI000E7029B1|nr:uncharacterized protein LOC113271551 [Papaver somniferum]XP_026377234.1 uncharacterized protein LOC113271551 [Papaver somniferum]
MGILNNQKGKSSSSSSSIKHVDHKIRKKCFKNRIKGFEKKFNELRKLCDVKAVGVVHSEFINGAKELPANPHEFDEVVMQFNQNKMKLCSGEEAEEVEKNQRFCFRNDNGNPKFDNLCTVESLTKIESELESIFVMISERENQLKAGDVTSPSSSSPNCDQNNNFGVIESTNYHYESTSLVVGSSNNVYDYGLPCSDYNQQQPQPEEEMKKSFGVVESNSTSLAVRSSKNLDDYGCSSSYFSNQEESQPLISVVDPFSEMVYDQPFSDMIDLEFQRLNCSSSYMDMMMNTTNPIDGPEFLLW